MRRQRITLQRQVAHKNCVGEVLYEWQDVCTTWSELKGHGVVTVRYNQAILGADRVVIGDQYYRLVGIFDRRELRLLELHIRPYNERDREIVSRPLGEQQRFRASHGPWQTQSK